MANDPVFHAAIVAANSAWEMRERMDDWEAFLVKMEADATDGNPRPSYRKGGKDADNTEGNRLFHLMKDYPEIHARMVAATEDWAIRPRTSAKIKQGYLESARGGEPRPGNSIMALLAADTLHLYP